MLTHWFLGNSEEICFDLIFKTKTSTTVSIKCVFQLSTL